MKQKITSILFFGLIVLSISTCKEDTEIPQNSLEAFFERQRDTEEFTVTPNPNEDIQIVGKQGTTVIIPAENFSEVEGDVTIFFEEFFDKSELILNNIPTNTRLGEWLETGGSFFLNVADENGDRIFLEEPIQLEFPIIDNISNPSDMSVWVGSRESSLLFNGSWRDNGGTVGADGSSVNADTVLNVYTLFSPFYTWINCDYVFESEAEKVQVKATVTNEEINSDLLKTFVVFENINAVVALSQGDGLEFESFPFPIGEEASLVIIAANPDLYLKIFPFTVAPNQNIDVELERVSEEELVEAVKILD